jgi:hypothetical protein
MFWNSINPRTMQTVSKDLLVRNLIHLNRDFLRIFNSLQKWHRAKTAATMPVHTETQRRTLLAGYLLRHACFIRLWADLPALHINFIDIMSGKPSPATVRLVHQGSRTLDELDAADRVILCSSVAAELHRSEGKRATFSITSYSIVL